MLKPAYTFLDWEKPAPGQQLRNTTIRLGCAAGVLANITSHDWRRGFARDMANSKTSTKLGVADGVVAKTLGQTHKSFATGITDGYVGDIEVETYTNRAEQMFEGRKQPLIGEPYRKVRVTTEEIDDYCNNNSMDATSKSERSKAAHHIRAKHKSDWITGQTNRTLSPAPTSSRAQGRTPSKDMQQERSTTPSQPKPPAETSIHAAEGRSGSSIPKATFQMLPMPEEVSVDFLELVDPQLLLDNNSGNIEVDGSAFQRFEDILVGDAPEPTEEETDEALEQLVENMQLSEEKENVLTMETHKFVESFSRINIVRNSAVKAG
jgi:hypothetical protein